MNLASEFFSMHFTVESILYACVCVCTYIHTYIYTYTYIYICICMCVYAYITIESCLGRSSSQANWGFEIIGPGAFTLGDSEGMALGRPTQLNQLRRGTAVAYCRGLNHWNRVLGSFMAK